MVKLKLLSAALAAAVCGLAGAREPGVKLPDIGSSAAEIMTAQQQHDYGASMLHEIRSYDLTLDDPLVLDYLNNLGYRLVTHSDRADLGFTFFIIRDNEINAFAAPGGYIAVNAGMIVASQSEAELAAVLAHEIAHITQQHLMRAFEDAQKSTLPIALAMLGMMIATAGRSDDAAQAALMTGTSLIQQRQINFTRHDEAEADRVGIQTLARAGYDPTAMAGTFATLQRVMRVNGVDVPEFLRTHPVDTNRIADAKARAEHLGCPSVQRAVGEKPAPTRVPGLLNLSVPTALPVAGADDDSAAVAASDTATTTIERRTDAASLPRVTVTACSSGSSPLFDIMRERVRVLTSDAPLSTLGYYADSLRTNTSFDTPANRYGYALALVRAQKPQEGVVELEKLAKRQPDNLAFQISLADAYEQAGRLDDALKSYQRTSEDHAGNRAATLAYAEALVARGEQKQARRAQDLLRPLLNSYGDDPDLQRTFARASELGGEKVRAGEAYAEAAYLNGHAEDALNQLKALAGQPGLDYYQRARIDARIAAMTPLVLELRHRGIKPDKQDGPAPQMSAFVCGTEACAPVSSARNNKPLK